MSPNSAPRRLPYLILFATSALFLAGAVALGWYAIAMYQNDMADGHDDGAAEAAGFAFMTALCPAAIGLVLLIAGLVVAVRRHAIRRAGAARP